MPSPSLSNGSRVSIDSLVVQFEGLWLEGRAPAIEDVVARCPSECQTKLLIELLHSDLELRLKAGKPARVEDYISRFPELSERREDLLQLIATEYRQRRRQEPGLDLSDYRLRFPELSDFLHDVSFVWTRIAPMPGQSQTREALPVVPGYEILERLGEGGMGIVWKARDLELKRFVAVKLVKNPEWLLPDQLARFRTEAEALARLAHPNIIGIHQVGEAAGQPYITLEYAEGGALSSRWAGNPQSPAEVADLVHVLANAIQAAHERGVIHRDLKPENVLLTADGTPKVTDFGLAKQLDTAGHTITGMIVGTASYMAPEQASGEVHRIGPATDVYALGTILYEGLTGRPPFKGASLFETLEQVRSQEPVPVRFLQPKVPRDLETICLKCLNKELEKRYATAQLLADDLRRFRAGEPIAARPSGLWERFTKWARRSPYRAAAVATGAVAIVAAAVALVGLTWSVHRELKEQQEQARVRQEFENLFATAQQEANRAAAGEKEAWQTVERAIREAQRLEQAKPTSFVNFPLLEPARRLLAQARGELDDALSRQKYRDRVVLLTKHHANASFFATLVGRLELPDSLQRTSQAVADGLKLFEADGDGPLLLDSPFSSGEEKLLVRNLGYELLLLQAQALTKPRAGDQTVGQWRGRLQEALDLLKKADAILEDKRTYMRGVLEARCLQGLGKNDEAQKAQQSAEQIEPKLASDFFLTALQRYYQGDLAGAKKPLAAALDLQPRHYGAEYLMALCLLNEGQFDHARVSLSRSLKEWPEFPWPLLLLRGYALMRLGEAVAAKADFDRVLSTSSKDNVAAYHALVDRGVLAMKSQHWDEAVADLTAAIARQPDEAAAYINLALVYRYRVKVPLELEQFLSLVPNGSVTLLALKAHQALGCREGVAILDEAIRRKDKVFRLFHERGHLYLLLGQGARASADLERAIDLAPAENISLVIEDLIQLGLLLHKEKKYEEAVARFKTALEYLPGRTLAYLLMAESLVELEKYQEAGEALDHFLKADQKGARPSNPLLVRAYRLRGMIHETKDQLKLAITSYTLGLSIQRDPAMLARRGWTYLSFGSTELAEPDFVEALKMQPEDADALMGHADALVKQGLVPEALAEAARALRQEPDTFRMLYNAARVHAQAWGIMSERKGKEADVQRALNCEREAVELLRRALKKKNFLEQVAFWHEHVEKDKAFQKILRGQAMRNLAEPYGRARR